MSNLLQHIKTKLFFTFLFLAFSSHFIQAQVDSLDEAKNWAKATMEKMSLDEKIGQLMWIRAHSDLGPDHIAKVEKLIKDYHVGGLTFFQGTPEKQIELINKYQKLSKIPLIISIDAEWGLGMRFKEDGFSFPKPLTLGAIQENRLIYDMGEEIAKHLKRVGVHVNFAPVADINNNPKNPVINTRSFGEDRFNVTSKAYLYMKGMQDNGIMACGKHFPGHGDTDLDSHYDLPLINHDINRIDSTELYPFKVLAEKGIQSMMVAHLAIPALDDTPNLPTTLSMKTVTNLLKDSLKFEGLVITDGLGMKGVTKHYKEGEVEARALQAGNDILLLPQNMEAAFTEIKKYLLEGKINEQAFNQSVLKALTMKHRFGAHQHEPIEKTDVRKDIFSTEAKVLKRKLLKASMTMVRNKNYLVPFQKTDTLDMASIALGAKEITPFQKRMDSYAKVKHHHFSDFNSETKINDYLNKLGQKEVVVVSLHDVSSYASKNYGFADKQIFFIKELAKRTQVVLTVFGTPYSLVYFDDIEWVQVAYEENEDSQDLAAQALFGAFGMKGRLPITASKRSTFHSGVNTPYLFRLGYDLPESVGLNSEKLKKIDSLAMDAVKVKATPSCVVLVAKDGKVVFEKAYGYHTYDKRIKTKSTDVFDLASLTKILSTTISIMRLEELNKIQLSKPLSKYLSELRNTNKKEITISEALTHQSGLQGWIKFYEETIEAGNGRVKPSSDFYLSQKRTGYDLEVTEKLFLKNNHRDTLMKRIYESDLRSSKDYKYSDLGFYLLANLVKRMTNKNIDQYVTERFYTPLGLQSATYNPRKKHDLKKILPTEKDNYFRNQTIHGYVHDMGAAMLGGVSGHAGLFANATDVAIIMQMLLNGGYYGGKQFLEPATVSQFTTRCTGCSRRGIGFDMLQTDKNEVLNFSDKASTSTFGHLGFTGTATWADPQSQIVYVILANRTYPSMKNNKYGRNDYRPKIQEAIYDALIINKSTP